MSDPVEIWPFQRNTLCNTRLRFNERITKAEKDSNVFTFHSNMSVNRDTISEVLNIFYQE